MKTYSAKPKDIKRKWHLIDAEGQVLGRLATQLADLLRGKNKPQYTPHIDTGDFVIVINAEKVAVTGKKKKQKEYQRYSGYPDGLKRIPYGKMIKEHPERVIEHAVRGMIPHNRLGRAMLKKLKVYAGPEHPHEAQGPEVLKINQT
jgi:large subunit ribosomal protein L13